MVNSEELLLKKTFSDKEVLSALTLIGQLGLNLIVTLLIFFFISMYLDKKLNTGNILLIIGTIAGIFSGVYLNYRHLKKYYEKEENKHGNIS